MSAAPAIDARLVTSLARSLTRAQASVLRDLGRGVGFAAFDLVDFHTSGSLAFRNRDRAICALERKGLVDGEDLTDLGRAVLAHHRASE